MRADGGDAADERPLAARHVQPEQVEVGLTDVKGLDAQVEEVVRSLDVFLGYATFRDELGGTPRRGILFEGPPGTGKTYLAKAMSKQAGVPFLFIVGAGVPVDVVRHDGLPDPLVLQGAAQGGAQGRRRDRVHRGDRRDRRVPRRHVSMAPTLPSTRPGLGGGSRR